MRRSFTLALKPFSVNAMYGRERNRKTQDYFDWESQAFHQLARPEPQQAMAELRAAFDANKHAYAVRLTFAFHADIFFTAKGDVSSRSFDLSNVEKGLIDLLFLPKHHEQAPPWGCPNLCIDDKLIVSLSSRKVVQAEPGYSIRVALAIVPKPGLK